jgi:SAM-dependent methyltransferase
MKPYIARTLSDAYSRKIHPRMDYTTDEGRTFAMRIAPYLSPIVKKGMRVVDLGSSFGKSAFLLCELGASVTGVDVSLGAIRFASNLGRTINADIAFVAADYAHLPFCKKCFDLALFPHNVVECSPKEFGSVVSEVSRILIDEGLFVISIANKWAKVGQSDPTLNNGTITIPGEGTFQYPTYSWSSESVQQIVSNYFRTVDIIDMPERGGTWLVFHK